MGGGLPAPTRLRTNGRPPAFPPFLDEDAANDLDSGAPLRLRDAGPGCAALGSSGYADDTQAVALGAASLQETVPATDEWLRVRGRTSARTSLAHGSQGNKVHHLCCSEGGASRSRRRSAS